MDPSTRNPLLEAMLHPFANFQKLANLQRPVAPTKKRDLFTRQNQGRGNLLQAVAPSDQDESRLALFATYREMERDAIVGQVLNIIAEDATTPDPERNMRIWPESANDDVRKILEEFFNDSETDDNAYSIVRTASGYGEDFEFLPADKTAGIMGFMHVPPFDVGRKQNALGQLEGFGPVDPVTGEVVDDDARMMAHWEMAHFRLRGAKRHQPGGESVLYLARDPWRQMQLMLDQIVLQRLLRRPDRLIYYLDAQGMGYDEVEDYIQEMQQSVQKEFYLDKQAGRFESEGNLRPPQWDMVIARPKENQTEVQNFPATNQNDQLRDFDKVWSRLLSSLNFPRGFFGFSEQGVYVNNRSIVRQDAQYAKRSMRIQQMYLREKLRVCAIHLIWKGIDPTLAGNAFRLRMAPVSTVLEEEYLELQATRASLMDSYLRLGETAGLEKSVLWKKTIFREVGRFPDEMVDALFGDEDSQTAFEAAQRAQRRKDPGFQQGLDDFKAAHPLLVLESEARRNGASKVSTSLPKTIIVETLKRKESGGLVPRSSMPEIPSAGEKAVEETRVARQRLRVAAIADMLSTESGLRD